AFANIDPLYRTVLIVEPGNVEAVGDVPIRIRIKGERPKELTLLRNVKGKRSSENVAVPPEQEVVVYTFRAVEQSLSYAVRGGDFTTPFYRIEVPTPPQLSLVRAVYHYPAYTNLAERKAESTGGDLEALTGTQAHVTFLFDQPADAAVLVLQRPARGGQAALVERLDLNAVSATEFIGDITFGAFTGYQIETRQA